MVKNNQDENNQDKNKKQQNQDPRKHPRPGYDEKNPTKKDIQEHPENQNTG